MFYYELHVFFSRSEGYSFGISSEQELIGEDNVILEAVKQDKFRESGDERYVDYTEKLDEADYIKYFKF